MKFAPTKFSPCQLDVEAQAAESRRRSAMAEPLLFRGLDESVDCGGKSIPSFNCSGPSQLLCTHVPGYVGLDHLRGIDDTVELIFRDKAQL